MLFTILKSRRTFFTLVVFSVILSGSFNSAYSQSIDKLVIPVTRSEALQIAQKYYDNTHLKIETGLKSEFAGITIPLFDGSMADSNLCKRYSVKVAGSISYTSAKNFYLALASAVFAYDSKNITAAANFATAISTYYDDLLLEKKGGKKEAQDFTSDAVKIYSYALALSAPDKNYNLKSINALNCFGNLLLDLKRIDDALIVFNTAHTIDPENYTTITGIYNSLMAKKQYDRAFKFISEHAKFAPIFTRVISKLTKQIPDEGADTGSGEATEEALEKEIESNLAIPVVTTADFIEEIDPSAAQSIRKDVKSIQDKMVIKAPNINYLLEIKNYENMSGALGQSAVQAFTDQMSQLGLSTLGYETQAHVTNNMAMLKQFGIEVESDIDMDNLQDLINDAIKNPSKYENYNPKVKVKGAEGVVAKAKKYQKDMTAAINKGRRGDSVPVFEQLAKTRPEFKIISVNPYLFSNPNDIILQRFNILSLTKKRLAYQSYMGLVISNAGKGITELMTRYNSKFIPMTMEYQKRLNAILNSDMDEDKKKIKIHALHTEYYPRFNRLGEPYWNQATEIAAKAYKKISKYAGPGYKECMKYVMLISDDEIRDRLEKDINGTLITDIKNALNLTLQAYTFAPYYDPNLCDCDIEEIKALKEKLEQEAHQLANEQIVKNMEDKKNFDQGVLDENSDYYKKFIKKYEYEVNLILVKTKVNPYQSKFEAGLDLSMFGINFSSVTNHLRNTTTYDGGISFGGEVAGATSLKSSFGFTAVKGSNGQFSPKDIDIRAGVEGSVNIGVVSLTGGVEASALRGTREYAQVGLTADKYLDDFKKKEKLEWLPSVGKEIWTGSYSEK